VKRAWSKLRETRWKWLAPIAYVLAVAASQLCTRGERTSHDQTTTHSHTSPVGATGGWLFNLTAFDDAGPVAGQICQPSLIHWKPATPSKSSPVLLLHGSPGSARNFDGLGPELAKRGYDAWAIDLPGFGDSYGDVPSYSIVASARTALAAMDGFKIERFHVVAWSMGGGVALHMADLAPERVASVSLVASIGVQEAEGSGNYYFEHLKYAVLWGAVVALPELVPHFGLIGDARERYSFVRNFWDTDQRPLRAILEHTRVPLLIVHGRDDFLVPVWCARISHELARDSRLVVVDGSHFLPIVGMQGSAETLDELPRFFERHEQPGVAEERATVEDTAPNKGLLASDVEPFAIARWVPWWLQCAAVLLAARRWRATTSVAVALLFTALQVDLGVVLIALTVGAASSRGGFGMRAKRVGAAVGWFALASVVAALAIAFAPHDLARSWTVASVALAASLIAYVFTRYRSARRLVPASS
jgi:pimeloyl-ACP methyl ester carboxylesterase